MTSYECLEIFMRVHLHFKIKSFDFYKSNSRLFKEKYPITEVIVNRIPNPKTFLGYCIANKIKNDDFFITDCLTQTFEETYQEWNKRIVNKVPNLISELSLLKTKNINILSDQQVLLYPLIIKNQLSWESLTLLYQHSKIKKIVLSEEIERSFEEYVILKVKKYSSFIEPIPVSLFKEIVSNA